jgi:hypothetical protein
MTSHENHDIKWRVEQVHVRMPGGYDGRGLVPAIKYKTTSPDSFNGAQIRHFDTFRAAMKHAQREALREWARRTFDEFIDDDEQWDGLMIFVKELFDLLLNPGWLNFPGMVSDLLPLYNGDGLTT